MVDACTACVVNSNQFPDISPAYVEILAKKYGNDPDRVCEKILQRCESGMPYLKRKREGVEDEEEVLHLPQTYDNPNRPQKASKAYLKAAKAVLALDFPHVHMSSILRVLKDKGNNGFEAYCQLCQITQNWNEGIPNPGIARKARVPDPNSSHLRKKALDALDGSPDSEKAREDLRNARWVQEFETAKRIQAKQSEDALEDGTANECGCCFGEFAENLMIHCSNPEQKHVFCVDCARGYAKAVVDQGNHTLSCMSTDGCPAGFSEDQRLLFLNDGLMAKLARMETEEAAREAGIGNLERCPFCPFAAEYPSIEEIKVFKCLEPECGRESCRICKKASHWPDECKLAGADRRKVEEAMSDALIRKCNKCSIQFVKSDGCNKMTCPKRSCRNTQCYICSKSCDYSHFDDIVRGGKEGNCPLFDYDLSLTERHKRDVREAEENARRENGEKFDPRQPEGGTEENPLELD